MYTARCAWLVGEGEALDAVGEALAGHACVVERVGTRAVAPWMARVRAGDVVTVPNLIVLTDEVAFGGETPPLEVLSARPPWRLLPVVVVCERDDAARCRAAYAGGAASWVVLEDSESRAEIAEAFARYWLDTALLPEAVAST